MKIRRLSAAVVYPALVMLCAGMGKTGHLPDPMYMPALKDLQEACNDLGLRAGCGTPSGMPSTGSPVADLNAAASAWGAIDAANNYQPGDDQVMYMIVQALMDLQNTNKSQAQIDTSEANDAARVNYASGGPPPFVKKSNDVKEFIALFNKIDDIDKRDPVAAAAAARKYVSEHKAQAREVIEFLSNAIKQDQAQGSVAPR